MLRAEGEQIMFRQNDRSQGMVVIDGTRSNGVTNGTIGTVESIVGSDVVVRLHDGRAATFNSMGYRAFHHAYAITAHKSQGITVRSEEHTSELQSLMRISYAVFCLKQ